VIASYTEIVPQRVRNMLAEAALRRQQVLSWLSREDLLTLRERYTDDVSFCQGILAGVYAAGGPAAFYDYWCVFGSEQLSISRRSLTCLSWQRSLEDLRLRGTAMYRGYMMVSVAVPAWLRWCDMDELRLLRQAQICAVSTDFNEWVAMSEDLVVLLGVPENGVLSRDVAEIISN